MVLISSNTNQTVIETVNALKGNVNDTLTLYAKAYYYNQPW